MDEFLVNQVTAGSQDQPSVAGFRGTQVVAVWEDNGADIKGILLGVNGVPTTPEFLVNFPGVPGTKRQRPKVIETSQGFAVAWTEIPPGGQPLLKLRPFDQDSLSGPEIQVSTAAVEPLIWLGMTRLADTGFAVAWCDQRQNDRIRVQRFTFDGTPSGSDLRANTAPGLHRYPMLAGLTNGNIVAGWRARIAPALHLRMQVFDTSGAVGTELIPNIEVTEPAMAALDNGQFVVAHIRNAGDSEPGFETTVTQASVFDANGTFVRRFPATGAARILSRWASVAPLSGGRFIVAWTEENVDNPAAGTNIGARVCSAQGALGKAIQVNTVTGGSRFSLSVATTANPSGELAFFAWNDDSKTSADQSGHAVKGRLMDVPANGF
jgi:hypothetical protein